MTRRCACRQPLSEQELAAAYSIGVRIKHDAEPCLLNESGEAGKLVGRTIAVAPSSGGRSAFVPDQAEPPSRVVPAVIAGASLDSKPRPVLTRLPRLTVVARP